MVDLFAKIPLGHALAAVTFGYLLGSIPFGLLLTRAAGLGDVRKIGSGNIGATNVLRTGNKGLAAATLLLDALKATLAVYLVYQLAMWWQMPAPAARAAGSAAFPTFLAANANATALSEFAGLAAFIGHIYPVWLRFNGGKGVATFIGATLGMYWPAAIFFGGVWLIVAYLLRISSLAALIASVLASMTAFIYGEHRVGILMLVMTALIFYKHEANIRRLLAGTEPKIGQKS